MLATETTLRQLVVFRLENDEYALPITAVQEIIRYTAPRSLQGESGGVINVRGRLVPVVDLASHFGRPAHEAGENAKILIVEREDGAVGIVVDAVDEVTTVPADAIDETRLGDGALVREIARIGERLVLVLDPAGL